MVSSVGLPLPPWLSASLSFLQFSLLQRIQELARAITQFYRRYAPQKAFQAAKIAKVYGSKSGGVQELFDKLYDIYGDYPEFDEG